MAKVKKEIDPVTALDELAAARARLEKYQSKRQKAEDELLEPYKKQLEKINEQVGPNISAVLKKIAELETGIREAVIAGKETIRGSQLMCQYVKDTEVWDAKMLSGIALDPERAWILGARSTKASTPRFVAIKEGE